jgi:hypothetical protein
MTSKNNSRSPESCGSQQVANGAQPLYPINSYQGNREFSIVTLVPRREL